MNSGIFQYGIKVNPKGFRYAQKAINGRDSHSFFHSGYHCATEAGTSGDLIDGEFLSQPFVVQQLS